MSENRGRLGGYAAWQFRDYALTTAGAATLLIPFVLGVFPLLMTKWVATKSGSVGGEVQNAYRNAFQGFVSILVLAGPMFSIAALVSGDRGGLTRFIFAKPVSVSAYYLQAWLVRFAGFMVISLVLAQIVNVFVTPVPWMAALEIAAVSWVLIGGLGMLLSVLISRDVAALIGFFLTVTIVSTVNQNVPTQSWWTKPALAVLPPFTEVNHVRDALLRGTPLPMGELWHVLIFGTACVVLATYLVRRLPLVR